MQQSEDLTLAPLRVPAFTVVGNKRSGTDFLQVGRATKWFWVVEHSLLLPDEKAVAETPIWASGSTGPKLFFWSSINIFRHQSNHSTAKPAASTCTKNPSRPPTVADRSVTRSETFG